MCTVSPVACHGSMIGVTFTFVNSMRYLKAHSNLDNSHSQDSCGLWR